MTDFYRFVYRLIAPFIRLFFPHRAVGLENLPEGGALLCANHASGWDPFLIAIALPVDSRLTVMAKDELFHWWGRCCGRPGCSPSSGAATI